MVKLQFERLIQKLALKMWNECSQVFTKQRREDLDEMINNPESKNKLQGLSLAEIATCKNLFVLENITMVIANQLLGNVGGAKSIHLSRSG